MDAPAPVSPAPRRFRIALSFPGEHRPFVEQVAEHLAAAVGRERVLYDKFYEAEFARVNLDVYLPRLYREQSELIVLFLCPEYAAKRWCRLEWRHIRQLIATLDEDRIMLVSFGSPGDLSELGILSGDGYVDIGSRPASEIAGLILQRLGVDTGAHTVESLEVTEEPTEFIEPKWSDELRIYGEGRREEPRETERKANVSVEFVTEISDNLNFMPLSPIYKREARDPGEVPQLVGFLVAHNRGVSPVVCNAFISVNSGMRDWPPHAVLAHWYGHDSDSIMIESGHSKKIIVAVLLEASWFYRWMIPYRWQGDSFYAHTAPFFRSEGAKPKASARISVKVKTDLPPVESLPLCSITVEGREIRVISNL
jgi:TIR domain-containing protein